ncbi:MAG: replication protein [Thermodesulfobacteriota bacterium]
MDNGSFVRIPTAVVDALMGLNLRPYEARVLFFIFRQQYGWHRGYVDIGFSRLARTLGLDRSNTRRALFSLADRNILLVELNASGRTRARVNPTTSGWLASPARQMKLGLKNEGGS